MDIQHVRYFVEVARQQSFSRAARQLYVTQPILTRCVKNLETELGVPLIRRSTRHFVLTEAGRALAERGAALIQQHQDIFRQLQDMAGTQTGELCISAPGVLLDMYFPRLMTQYRRAHPGVRITVRECGTRTVVRDVREGTADLGLVMFPLAEPESLQMLPIVRDEIHVLVHQDHPLACQPCIRAEQLRGLDIITYNESTTLYHALNDLCRKLGFAPTIAYQSMMPRFILDTLCYGDCVGVLPAPMLRQFPRPELCSIPFEPRFPWEIAMVTQETRYMSRAADSFMTFAQNYLGTDI